MAMTASFGKWKLAMAVRAAMLRAIMALATAAVVTLATFGPAAPAAAQFSDSYNFIKAVRDKDVLKAKGFLDKPGSVLVNSRDRETGEAALHIVTRRNDAPWVAFLLKEGAEPNIRDGGGNSPLLLAASAGLTEAMRVLLLVKAQVDLPNNGGETPLIKAVQLRDLAGVKALLDAGADPDRTDSVAGLSARDYAAQDRRGGAIARLLADAPRRAKPATTGPRL